MNSIATDSLRSRVAAYVVSRIMSGEWEAGYRIPSENKLAVIFGASRMTVHHALRDLTNRGFLTRRSGSGTFVAMPQSYVAVYPHSDLTVQIEARGQLHRAEVLTRELIAANDEQSTMFGCSTGTTLFHAYVLHHADDRPIELEDRLIDPQAMPDCMSVDLTRQTLFSRLMLVRPYRTGSESVRAVLPSKEEISLLGLLPGHPCLEVVRRTWSDDRVITHARILRVGDHGVMSGSVRHVT